MAQPANTVADSLVVVSTFKRASCFQVSIKTFRNIFHSKLTLSFLLCIVSPFALHKFGFICTAGKNLSTYELTISNLSPRAMRKVMGARTGEVIDSKYYLCQAYNGYFITFDQLVRLS